MDIHPAVPSASRASGQGRRTPRGPTGPEVPEPAAREGPAGRAAAQGAAPAQPAAGEAAPAGSRWLRRLPAGRSTLKRETNTDLTDSGPILGTSRATRCLRKKPTDQRNAPMNPACCSMVCGGACGLLEPGGEVGVACGEVSRRGPLHACARTRPCACGEVLRRGPAECSKPIHTGPSSGPRPRPAQACLVGGDALEHLGRAQ